MVQSLSRWVEIQKEKGPRTNEQDRDIKVKVFLNNS